VKFTVTFWVNENRPRCVPFPGPLVVTTTVVPVKSLSTSSPCSVPLKGTCLCAAARRGSDDGVTDAVMDGADVGIVGEGIVGDVL